MQNARTAGHPSIDPADIRRQAELWKATLRVPLTIVHDLGEVEDGGIRARIQAGAKIRGWQSPEKGYFVYLPAFRDTSELDSSVMHEVVGAEGPRSLITQRGWDRMRDLVWDRMYKPERDKHIAKTDGDPSSPESWRAAAQAFIEAAATRLSKHDDKDMSRDKAFDEWNFVMNCLYTSNGPIANNLGIQRREFSRLFAAAVRINERERKNVVPQLTRSQTSAVIAAALDDLEARRNTIGNDDLGRTYEFGFPGTIYMSCTPKAKRFPMRLRLAALFGYDGEKQERHYFPFSSIKGLVDALDDPLAIVDSKDVDKPSTLMVITRLKIEQDGKTCYFVVPVTPRKKEPEGYWYNNFDSVYPKPEKGILHWLKNQKKHYLAPDLEEAFLEPARARFEASVAEDRAETATPDQQARDLNPPDLPESRPVEERPDVVRAEFDVVANIARNFENPIATDENVRFFQNLPQRGDRTLKESNPLSMYNFLADEEKVDLVGMEFRQSMTMLLMKDAIPPSHMPRLATGQAITESGGLSLRMQMLCNYRWRTPFFVTQQQAASWGIRTTGPSCSVIYFSREKGEFFRTAVYNLADTTFPEKFESTYEGLCERYSAPPRRYGEGVDAVVQDALSRTFTDDPVERTLVEFAIRAAAGQPFNISKSERKMLTEDIGDMGNDKLYKAFESAGRRWTNACRRARIMPEREESLENAIGQINVMRLIRETNQTKGNGIK